MKPLLCRLGFHRPNNDRYETVTRYHRNGKTYRTNYIVCKGCGKRLGTFAIVKEKKS